jgi:hypothetical protein
LRAADGNGRNHNAQRKRGSAENPCPHGPNPLAPARSDPNHAALRLCEIGATLGRSVKKIGGPQAMRRCAVKVKRSRRFAASPGSLGERKASNRAERRA